MTRTQAANEKWQKIKYSTCQPTIQGQRECKASSNLGDEFIREDLRETVSFCLYLQSDSIFDLSFP